MRMQHNLNYQFWLANNSEVFSKYMQCQKMKYNAKKKYSTNFLDY